MGNDEYKDLLADAISFLSSLDPSLLTTSERDTLSTLLETASDLGIEHLNNHYDGPESDNEINEYDECEDDDEEEEEEEEVNDYDEADEDEDEIYEVVGENIYDTAGGDSDSDSEAIRYSQRTIELNRSDSLPHYDRFIRVCERSGPLDVKAPSNSNMLNNILARPRKRRAILYDFQLFLYPLKETEPEHIIDLKDSAVKPHQKKRDRFSVTLPVHKNQVYEFKASDPTDCGEWLSILEQTSRGFKAMEINNYSDPESEHDSSDAEPRWPEPEEPKTFNKGRQAEPDYDVPPNNRPVLNRDQLGKSNDTLEFDPEEEEEDSVLSPGLPPPPLPFRNKSPLPPTLPPKEKSPALSQKTKKIPPKPPVKSKKMPSPPPEESEDSLSNRSSCSSHNSQEYGTDPTPAPPPPPPMPMPKQSSPPPGSSAKKSVPMRPEEKGQERKLSVISVASSTASSNYSKKSVEGDFNDELKEKLKRRMSEKLVESSTVVRERSPKREEETEFQRTMRLRKEKKEKNMKGKEEIKEEKQPEIVKATPAKVWPPVKATSPKPVPLEAKKPSLSSNISPRPFVPNSSGLSKVKAPPMTKPKPALAANNAPKPTVNSAAKPAIAAKKPLLAKKPESDGKPNLSQARLKPVAQKKEAKATKGPKLGGITLDEALVKKFCDDETSWRRVRSNVTAY